jgi:hypothetical protein
MLSFCYLELPLLIEDLPGNQWLSETQLGVWQGLSEPVVWSEATFVSWMGWGQEKVMSVHRDMQWRDRRDLWHPGSLTMVCAGIWGLQALAGDSWDSWGQRLAVHKPHTEAEKQVSHLL